MSKKVIIILMLAVMTGLLFTGCELSASNNIPPLASPTTDAANPASQATGIGLIQQWGTITAIYLETAAAQGLVPTSETPQPSLTSTPIPTADLTNGVPPTGSATRGIGGMDSTPTETRPAVAATVTPGRPSSYTLKQGEFPYCIARRFNVNQNDLLAANNLTDAQATDLPVGTPLKIPQSAGPFIGTRYYHAHPGTFTVGTTSSKITTIYGVACYYGDIDPTVIAAANGLSLTSPLSTGQTLTIP